MEKVITYSELASLCRSEEGIAQLKVYIQQVADIIDGFTLDFLNDIDYTIEEYSVIQKKLTGSVMYLNPIVSYTAGIKRTEALRKFVDLKKNFIPETVKDKFVATSATQEAELSVEYFREVRNMSEAYLKSAESGIYFCKDRVLEKKKEYKASNE